jgi:hypothetical protein
MRVIILLVIAFSVANCSVVDKLFGDQVERRVCEFLVNESYGCSVECLEDTTTLDAGCYDCVRRVNANQKLFERLGCRATFERVPASVGALCQQLKDVAEHLTNVYEAMGCFGVERAASCDGLERDVYYVTNIGIFMKCV